MHEVTLQNAAEVAKAVKDGKLPGPAASLAEAVCRVMAAVGYVQKDKQMMGGGSYKYVSVEAVIDALRPEMVKNLLVMLPSAVEPLTIETFEGKNGGRQNRTQVKYTFDLIHAPSGESRPVVVIGEAIDVGDKSSNKAMTAARKYALIMAFNIETGLDPDDTPSASQERAPERVERPRPQPPKVDAPQPPKSAPAQPASGAELHRRLQDYDAKLAQQKLCVRGALLAHVVDAGVKAGFASNMTEWAGPAIPFAVEVVKGFEQSLRAGPKA